MTKNNPMSSLQRVLEKAEGEADAGRLWRAREILQGSIGNWPESPELLLAYGRVLMDLGDMVEAGKYLFISGTRGSEVDEAIGIFLERHGRGRLGDLLGQLPQSLRGPGLSKLPAVVRDDLEALGLFPDETTIRARELWSARQRQSWLSRSYDALLFGFSLIAAIVALILVVGLWMR